MSGVPLVSVFVEGDSTMNIEAQFNLIAEEYDCNRRKLDKECSVEAEIQMLNRCGFSEVKCIYSYHKFSVIIAVK